jgi:hypothetical protein
MKALIASMVLATSLCATAAPAAKKSTAWNNWNNPYKMDANFQSDLNLLPTTGELSSGGLAWPGSYWPNNKGSIAWRWTAKKPNPFKYESPSMYEATQMTPAQINELSPAEKYDMYVGRYDYPTVARLFKAHRKGEAIWHGICHGVAPASLHHKEPKTVTVTNADGIKIKFYASDVKALLANHYAKISDTGIIQVGKRCFVGGKFPFARKAAGCKDVNPGAFHIIVANKLGISKTGFVADLDRYKAVWNHPAISFKTKIISTVSLSKRSPKTAVKRVKIHTDVTYQASVDPQKEAIIGTVNAKFDTRKYEYYLDLNSKGQILGGEWISKQRPDFMWTKVKDEFKGHWSKLEEIYKSNI